jgi:hypothetical protein
MKFNYFAAFAVGMSVLAPTISYAQSKPLVFRTVAPCRVLDTRNPEAPLGGPELQAGKRRDIIPGSDCGVLSAALAYSLNITVVPDGKLGFLTIWPAGEPQPQVSTLNSDGRVKANAVIVPAGLNGGLSIYATDPTQLIIDINGFFIPDNTDGGGLMFYPLTPCRVVDTRSSSGPLAGPFLFGGAPGRRFQPLSSNCNLPSNVAAYSMNFTAVPHGPLGYLTVWPSDQSLPSVSTLNASTGAITANAAIVPAAADGGISVFASNDTDLVIDVNGYFAPPTTDGLDLYTVTPCRVLDTRDTGAPFNGTVQVTVTGTSCLPRPGTAPLAYVMNATVVPPGSLAWLTLWPDAQALPLASTLNALDGAITSNMAIIPTSNTMIDAFGSNPTQLILDLSGYFAPFVTQ